MGAGQMNPQKLMTSIVGKVPPDVITQDRFTISDWASRGAFTPLDPLIIRDEGKDPSCPRKSQYYPAAWNETMYEGKVYAIPTEADNRVLYWNKATFRKKADKLRAAGLDPERPPRTWSEMLKYSKALTEHRPDGTLTAVGFMPNYGNSWLYLYAFQNNASFISPDGRTCTLASPEAVEALQFLVDGYEAVGGYETAKAFESGFLAKENDAFITGKVAMKIDGDWILNDLSRYAPQIDVGTAPPPVPDDRFYHRGRFKDEKDTFISWGGGFSYAIPTGARNTEDGWTFIKWATSTEARLLNAAAQRKWEQRRGRAFIQTQQGSREANEKMFAAFKPADAKFAAALKTHVDLMPTSRIRPSTFVGQLLWDEHVRALENAAYKKMSPKDALLAGQAIVQRELDAFYNRDKYPVVDLRIPTAIFGGLLAIVAIVLVVLYRRQRLGNLARNEARWAYLFLSPWILGFLIFTLGPMLASLFFSFTQYNVLSDARWVGVKNYTDMVTVDQVNVSKAFYNAGYLAAVGVPFSLVTGLAVALLLNAGVRGMRAYRTFFYMPAIVPGVASAVLWAWILTPDAGKGLVNAGWNATITQWMNIAPPTWLNSEAWAKPSLILMGLWGAGSGMVLWLAGLKGVSSTLYEAASIDGATARQSFWSVTMPTLSPIIFFNAVMGIIGAIQEFDRVYIMKPSAGSAGPSDSMLTPVFHLFQNGFAYFRMGYASSLAWTIFLVILLLTFIQFKLAPRWVHYEADKS